MGLLSRFKQKKESSDSHDSGEFRSRSEEDSAQSRSRGKKPENTRKNKANDPVLPEKKRARRRLIGATALALAAIIGLPMVFDSEPKPLPEDITIRIPSKDKVPELEAAKPVEPAPPRKKDLIDVDPGEEIIDPVSPANGKSVSVVPIKSAIDDRVITQLNTTERSAAKSAAITLPKVESKSVTDTSDKVVEVKSTAKPEVKVEKKADNKLDSKLKRRLMYGYRLIQRLSRIQSKTASQRLRRKIRRLQNKFLTTMLPVPWLYLKVNR